MLVDLHVLPGVLFEKVTRAGKSSVRSLSVAARDQYGGPVGPLRRNFFFQNAYSSGVATDVESQIPTQSD